MMQHRVNSGESLFSLSRKYRVSVDELKSANPPLLASDMIREGQTLVLPHRLSSGSGVAHVAGRNPASSNTHGASALESAVSAHSSNPQLAAMSMALATSPQTAKTAAFAGGSPRRRALSPTTGGPLTQRPSTHIAYTTRRELKFNPQLAVTANATAQTFCTPTIQLSRSSSDTDAAALSANFTLSSRSRSLPASHDKENIQATNGGTLLQQRKPPFAFGLHALAAKMREARQIFDEHRLKKQSSLASAHPTTSTTQTRGGTDSKPQLIQGPLALFRGARNAFEEHVASRQVALATTTSPSTPTKSAQVWKPAASATVLTVSASTVTEVGTKAEPADKPTWVRVQPGDTLGKLAKEHGLSVRELQWLNALRDENVVAGMQLYVADCPNNKKRHRPSAGNKPLALPVSGDEAYVTSGFGWRWGRFHEGVDLAADIGTPILAADDGVVSYADWNHGYGKLLTIVHPNGYTTRYGHCDELVKKVGDRVKRGQKVATVGNTGHSTGPHLHFEVRVEGMAEDPFDFIEEV